MEKKEKTRETILSKAREIFLKKGLFDVIMDDIAEEAGLTRRTLYRYFATKEDLAFETTIGLIDEWNSYQKEVASGLQGSGLDRLETFLGKLIEYMSDRLDVMRYLGEFDFYFKGEKESVASEEERERFEGVILESDDLLREMLERGIGDKSIRDQIDIPLTIATISNVLWSFAQRVAARDSRIIRETGYRGVELIAHQVSLYIDALKENR
ncbi:TetR/AcrR family transcriptional regulator [Spirochaeta isovalerica]|uniref:AcrR family transcriptional regulator n=1 Tax=Spirochaeta isovalerica TaxID=150 RepID=A0A841RCU1_9SPIO|nr:TetR/AcrR family transcriptional regulator [Spirochaeta isovalerica]MBB6481211.1 AcrR family transcriptional regulator [Spirochaeta isovalerica]